MNRYRSRFEKTKNFVSKPFSKKSFSKGSYSRKFSRMPMKSVIKKDMYIKKAKEIESEPPYVPSFLFKDLNLNSVLKNNILNKGFLSPTPIQDKALNYVLEGHDLLGIANTGTGKTAVFLIPLIEKVIKDNSQKVLIITPTRELSEQIKKELLALTRDLRIFSVECIGGDNIFKQIQQLRRGVNFIIGTPGRLKDLKERGEIKLNQINNLVLDEVDRMLDMGFVDEIKAIIKDLPEKRQSLFFSATINKKVESLINFILKNNFKKVSASTGLTAESIEQDIIEYTDNIDKINKLESLLKQKPSIKALIFANTKRGVERLDNQLFNKGFKVTSIHGDKRQNYRRKALDSFKTGRTPILIATDVAARGLDISGVTHVINYDEPNSYDDYIHRIGRTGRANQKGNALTFVSKYHV